MWAELGGRAGGAQERRPPHSPARRVHSDLGGWSDVRKGPFVGVGSGPVGVAALVADGGNIMCCWQLQRKQGG